MGLAQKRIIQEFQTTEFQKWKTDFDKVVGFEMPMEVKWDTLQSNDSESKVDYFRWYNQVYFSPLMKVFTALCADSMGKDAVKGAVKKIVIDGTDGIYASSSTFDNGTLHIKHKFDSNTHKEDERIEVWTKLVESKL
jgi:hypothetical protein